MSDAGGCDGDDDDEDDDAMQSLWRVMQSVNRVRQQNRLVFGVVVASRGGERERES